MFWNNFESLCKKNGTTPTAVAKDIGISTSMTSGWRHGRNPRLDSVVKIASYFAVPVTALLDDLDYFDDLYAPNDTEFRSDDMKKETLVERIDLLCAERGIKRATALIESGVGKNFVSNLKTSNASIQKLTALANYFNVSVAYLTGAEDNETYARKVMNLVAAWLIDNDYSYEEDNCHNVTIGKDGKYISFTNADFMTESLCIKKASKNGFDLAMTDWIRRKFSFQHIENRSHNHLVNSINESPNATLTVTENNLSKQEVELIEIYRNLSLLEQMNLIAYAIKLKNEER